MIKCKRIKGLPSRGQRQLRNISQPKCLEWSFVIFKHHFMNQVCQEPSWSLLFICGKTSNVIVRLCLMASSHNQITWRACKQTLYLSLRVVQLTDVVTLASSWGCRASPDWAHPLHPHSFSVFQLLLLFSILWLDKWWHSFCHCPVWIQQVYIWIQQVYKLVCYAHENRKKPQQQEGGSCCRTTALPLS